MLKSHFKYLSIILLFFVVIFIFYYKNCYKNDNILLIYDKSWFSSFDISEDVVNTYCWLTIYNGYNYDKNIKLTALDTENSEQGLLSDPYMIGYEGETNKSEIDLKPGENLIYVVFVGKFGKTEHRANRLLPNKINTIDKE